MYRTIDAAFWTDPKVRKLAPVGKLLLLYLVTNPHSHVSGIYCLSRAIISEETGLDGRGIDTLTHTLVRAGMIMLDDETGVVWVVNMMKYQGKGENHYKSAAFHVKRDLHKSRLIPHFLRKYPEVMVFCEGMGIEGVMEGVPYAHTPENGEQRAENGEQRTNTCAVADEHDEHAPMPGFVKFWSMYPKKGKARSSKKETLDFWKKEKLEAKAGTVITGLSRWIKSEQWQTNGGQYVKGVHRWLKKEMYNDEPEAASADADQLLIDPPHCEPDEAEALLRKVGLR